MKLFAQTIPALAIVALLSGCSLDPVAMNESGALEESDATHPDDGSFYDPYKFKADAGWTVTVTMTSTAEGLTPFLHMHGPEGFDQQADGVGGNIATINTTAPTKGEYEVWANSRQPGETGAYTIAIVANPAQ
ncbi:MAG: hypothetical protein AAGF12_29640 [Myxococcota bacterium]